MAWFYNFQLKNFKIITVRPPSHIIVESGYQLSVKSAPRDQCQLARNSGFAAAAQRAKFAKKVHKPPLRVNAINFELNGFNASIWVPWSPSDPKKL